MKAIRVKSDPKKLKNKSIFIRLSLETYEDLLKMKEEQGFDTISSIARRIIVQSIKKKKAS